MYDTANVIFDLERFVWTNGAFELLGRWGGDTGALGPVRLIVEIDGRRRDIAAQGAMAAAPGDGWRARFECARAPSPHTSAVLTVGGLEVELPVPEILHWGSVEREPEVAPSYPPGDEGLVEMLRAERAALEDARQRLESERRAAEDAEVRLTTARRTVDRPSYASRTGYERRPAENMVLVYVCAGALVFVFLLLMIVIA